MSSWLVIGLIVVIVFVLSATRGKLRDGADVPPLTTGQRLEVRSGGMPLLEGEFHPD